MKKLISILLCTALLFTLSACTGANSEKEGAFIECETEFVHLSYKEDLPEEPVIKVISTKNEFDAFYNEMNENENHQGSMPVFLDFLVKYTEEFFEDKSIIFTIFHEGSGSHRFKLNSCIKGADGKLYANIEDTRKGGIMTDNYVSWCAFIEIDKQHIPENLDDIVILKV